MKRNPKRVMRTVISLVLSLMMVLGMATTAFAAPQKVERSDVEAKIVELYGMLEDYCAENADAQAALETIKDAVAGEEFEAAKAEVEAYLAENEAAIDAYIDELLEQINDLNEYLYDLKDELAADPEVQASIDEIIAQITSLEDEVAAVKAEQDAMVAAGEEVLAAIDEIVAIVLGESDADIVEAIEALQASFDGVVAVAEGLYDEVEAAVEVAEAVLAEVDALVVEVAEAAPELVAAIEEAVAAIDAAIAEAMPYIEAAIEEAIAYVEELIAEFEAAIADAIEAATTCDYVIDEDSYYLAIGDEVAADYANIVAAELGVKNSAIDVDADDLLDTIEAKKADIEKADLITLGYGNAEIIEAVLDYVAEPTELDWAKYVGTEYEGYVEEAIAAVQAELAKNGIEGEAADLILDAVEAYAYEYTALLCNYPAAVEAIKAINPEAQVIIVGMHNPLAGLVVDVEGTEVAVGDYVDYIIAASNAYYFGYALLTGNAIYVDAPDAAIGLDADKVYGADDLIGLLTDVDAFYPTEEGNAYIAEQILNAMNITVAEKGLLGDADGDGYVLANDAMLVLQYSTGVIGADALNLDVCDVDGDGEVLANDAMLILQYSTGVITVFPIEE